MYTYKKNNYDILKQGKMKHPDTGEWLDCMIYISDKKDDPPFVRELKDFESKFKLSDKIPYHIQIMGKLFGILKDPTNVATGEIKWFHSEGKNPFKRGQRLTSSEYIDGEDYCAIWVHISNNYFKQIGLWEASPFTGPFQNKF